MVTREKITLDGTKAMLTKDGQTFQAEILLPTNTSFKIVMPPPLVEKEKHRRNISMLAATVQPAAGENVRIVVLLTPVGDKWKEFPVPEIEPIGEWK